ncbi:MAG: hypothetical protein M3340_13400 [Actinomycetota bacterium]|nr:hypothetical protein [Actinomycetota bacterium]
MSDYALETHEEGPLLLDFDDAELVPPKDPGTGGVVLRVRGQAPCMNMVVRLVPVRYIQQPEYWVVHVVGDLQGGVCLEAIRDYDEILAPSPLGKRGVVVVGESKRELLENPQ